MPEPKPALPPVETPRRETRGAGRPRKNAPLEFQSIRWISRVVIVEQAECPGCSAAVEMLTERTTNPQKRGIVSHYWTCPRCRRRFVARGQSGEKPSSIAPL